jgi:Ca-activated chloride channel family protein
LRRVARGGELMRVKLRYKEPEGSTSQVREWPVMDRPRSFEEASPDFKFAAAVAQFGMILRNSPYKGTASLSSVLALADAGRGEDASGYRAEFAALVKRAQELQAAE